MRLHENPVDFQDLITITAGEKHIPESAVEDLLYTDTKQCFDDAVIVFDRINTILAEIGE